MNLAWKIRRHYNILPCYDILCPADVSVRDSDTAEFFFVDQRQLVSSVLHYCHLLELLNCYNIRLVAGLFLFSSHRHPLSSQWKSPWSHSLLSNECKLSNGYNVRNGVKWHAGKPVSLLSPGLSLIRSLYHVLSFRLCHPPFNLATYALR